MYVEIELKPLLIKYFLHCSEVVQRVILGDRAEIVLELESFFGEA